MITYREYCKTIREDWGKTSPIPKEVYDFPDDPLKGIKWVDLGLKSGLLWAESNTLNPADGSPYWTWDEIMASDYAEHVPEVKNWVELANNRDTMMSETEMRTGKLRIPLVGYYPQGDTSVSAGSGGYYWTAEEGEYPDEAIHVFIRPGQNSIVKDFDYKTSKMCLRLVKYK